MIILWCKSGIERHIIIKCSRLMPDGMALLSDAFMGFGHSLSRVLVVLSQPRNHFLQGHDPPKTSPFPPGRLFPMVNPNRKYRVSQIHSDILESSSSKEFLWDYLRSLLRLHLTVIPTATWSYFPHSFTDTVVANLQHTLFPHDRDLR